MGVCIKFFEFREKVRIHSHTDVGPKKTVFFGDLINYCSLVHKEYEQGKQH